MGIGPLAVFVPINKESSIDVIDTFLNESNINANSRQILHGLKQ